MKIFMSHSSKDKAFVERLSLDLLRNGLPVWLDNWEMQAGDSLYEKIYSGLDNSSYIIIIVSGNYNKSIWTTKEFRATLAREDRDKKTILIPILIDDTTIPLEISDRIYKNFVDNYDKELLNLVRFFNNNNVSINNVEISERLIPLVFDDYINLDMDLLISVLNDRNDQLISKKQIWIKGLDLIDDLVINVKKSIENNPIMGIEIKNQLKKDYIRIGKLLNYIYNGTEIILNSYKPAYNSVHHVSISLYWLHKMILGTIFEILYRYSDIKHDHGVNIERSSIFLNAFGDNISFCSFFKIESCRSLVIYDPKNMINEFSFLIDSNNHASKMFEEIPFPGPVAEFYNIDLLYKYIIPQNVFGHLNNEKNIRVMNEFHTYYLGLS